MKHTIAWSITGTVEFESDETEIDAIVEDFDAAVGEGWDPMRHGEVDGLDVDEVDGQHVHRWYAWHSTGALAGERCTRCSAQRPHVHNWAPGFKDSTQQRCRSCFEIRPTPVQP